MCGRARRAGAALAAGLAGLPGVVGVRGEGLLLAAELAEEVAPAVAAAALERGPPGQRGAPRRRPPGAAAAGERVRDRPGPGHLGPGPRCRGGPTGGRGPVSRHFLDIEDLSVEELNDPPDPGRAARPAHGPGRARGGHGLREALDADPQLHRDGRLHRSGATRCTSRATRWASTPASRPRTWPGPWPASIGSSAPESSPTAPWSGWRPPWTRGGDQRPGGEPPLRLRPSVPGPRRPPDPARGARPRHPAARPPGPVDRWPTSATPTTSAAPWPRPR